MAREKAIGIDLGTTNSAMAWVDESGRSQMVPNAEGSLLTPSIVLFGDREVIVGKEARSATTVSPERVAEWVKRDMGAPVFSHAIRGEYLPPEVIQACILRKLRADLAHSLGPDANVVITVPAYFDEPRRKATADAGEMAGLTVLDIVNEPTAAALAFGESLGYLAPGGEPKEEMTVLVYDLGGGTFDVTLLKLAQGKIQTLATDGDVRLGGHDWDMRLVDYAAESFLRQHGIDPRTDPAGLNRVYQVVIEAKHTLSARNRATIRIDHDGKSAEIPITQDQFRELTADLLERTAYTTRQLLAASGLQWKHVSRLLLVGGATRMPMVAEMLSTMTGVVPDRTVNPDEAVARGAALYAGYLLVKRTEDGPPADFEVTNVNAHSLGVEGIDPHTMRRTNVILIPRNTPLPATHTERFATKSKGQRSIVVQILEGESSIPGDCTAIGRTAVRDLPDGLPQGWPVEVTFEYGSNGRLSVRAVVPGTHHEAALSLERAGGMSGEGIARWKQPVGASAGFEAFGAAAEDLPAVPRPSPTPASPEMPRTDADTGFWSSPVQSAAAAAATSGPTPPSAPDRTSPPASGRTGQPASPRRLPRWAILLIGYVASAIVGLGLGYLVLSRLRPEFFPLPW
ncbi:MAG: Hsp70 family protein [Pirellulales bacterium]|nr:Hsp70 family protein [Pirellulales bacterium]